MIMKKSGVLSVLLILAMLAICFVPAAGAPKAADAAASVAADWHFSEDSVLSGSLENGDLVLKDQSGNGNNLVLSGSNAEKYLQFSSDTMYDGTSGSLTLNNEKQKILGRGAEFITADDAPINKETFRDGYTIELIYKLPDDFAGEDAWMGLLARKGKCETMTETRKCTMSLAVSNCKELQFLTANADDSHEMDSAWSVSMDKGGVWYHIAIVSDGHTISTFVNGCEAFRDYESDEMQGMFASPDAGQFVIGGYDNGISDHHARGALQQVRISAAPLDKSQWLIPDPENYIDEYGENLPFTNLSKTSYNVIFLPDIQNATEFRPQVLYTAAQWLSDNRDTVRPAAIVSLGDTVNTYSDPEQWDNALTFYNKLETVGCPLLQQPGNHDYGDNYYLDAFGPQSDFGARQTQNGVVYSPSGFSSYMFFDAGSYHYMVLSISMAHVDDEEERAWMDEALTTYADCPTIVTSHSFQDCDAAKPDEVVLNDHGKSIWEIVRRHNQVFMMISGHNHGAGEEVLKNDSGNEVFSILADYQFSYNGGNAFFKFAEFDEAANCIRLSTFSPYAATLSDSERTFFDVNYMTGAGNYTVYQIDFETRFAGLKASADREDYQAALKAAGASSQNALFENVKTVSAADAHTVDTSSGNVVWIVVLCVAAVVVILLVVCLAVKRKKKKTAQKAENNR